MVARNRPPGKPTDNGLSLGEARRDAAHARLEADHARVVLTARRMMAVWLLEFGTITADDVQGLVELPPTVNPTLMGATPMMFARRRWIVADGYVRSRRPQAHARPVIRWRLVDAGALSAWLADNPATPQPAGVGA
jgi:hypothetical protein